MTRIPLSRRRWLQTMLHVLGSSAGIGLNGITTPQPPLPPPQITVRATRIERLPPADPLINRSDLRTDPTDGSLQPGMPLTIKFRVYEATKDTLSPLAGARIDLWGANVKGFYSDVNDSALNTLGRKFLRGYQFTQTPASGSQVPLPVFGAGGFRGWGESQATFVTTYPGWYYSRAVHLHFRIQSAPDIFPPYEFSAPLFFDDALSDTIYHTAPYNTRGKRHTLNEADLVFRQYGASLLVDAQPVTDDPRNLTGYAATFVIALHAP